MLVAMDAAEMVSIKIYEGSNVIGRTNFASSLKQLSRNHINIMASLDGSADIIVEGSNPIILKSGSSNKKLAPQTRSTLGDGDVIEMLPGKLPFKYTTITNNKQESDVLVHSTNDDFVDFEFAKKRKRQIEDDEALARSLQEMEHQSATEVIQKDCLKNKTVSSTRTQQTLPEHCEPSSFQLMHVQGLPQWANAGCVKIGDVIKGDVLVAILSNYMVDISWLLSACPSLRNVPQVVVIHGESGQSLEHMKASKPQKWILYKPPLRLSYGTHHSKAMLLVYSTGVRVIIHTANLIYVDWNNKSQGLWMQDFPLKADTGIMESSDFENDLVDYLTALEWAGCTVDLACQSQVKINAAYFRNFDYTNAAVRIVASVPGYHQGRNLTKWGHTKVRTILEKEIFDEQFHKSPLVYQFSSLGSLDEKWMGEFSSSLCAGSMAGNKLLGPGSADIIWPTVEDVRWSLEGYAAGNAIPSPEKNVTKEFLKKYWARWKADHTGRNRAMPHIKSYVRYNNQSLAWFILTSSNLSKAAWGALQKNKSQLMIRSYELGVIFLPSLAKRFQTGFSCTDNLHPSHRSDFKVKLCTLMFDEPEDEHLVRLPVPYALPPIKYGSEDQPWSWDRHYSKSDVYGLTWPRSVKLYT